MLAKLIIVFLENEIDYLQKNTPNELNKPALQGKPEKRKIIFQGSKTLEIPVKSAYEEPILPITDGDNP